MDESVPTLTMERGVWVLHAGVPLLPVTVEEVIRELREKRDLVNFVGHSDGGTAVQVR
jgi:hypothetical protein